MGWALPFNVASPQLPSLTTTSAAPFPLWLLLAAAASSTTTRLAVVVFRWFGLR